MPQGVLGPLLFLTYINDIYNQPISNKLFLYAEDPTIFASNHIISDNFISLSSDITQIEEFLKIN